QPAPLDETQEGDQGEETKVRGREPEGQPSTETRVPTYGELFGLESEFHAEIPARVPGDGEGQGDERGALEAEEQPSAEQLPADQPPTEKRVPTYAEVFSVGSDLDAGIPAHAPEDEEGPGGERAVVEAEEQLPAAGGAPAPQRDGP